MNSTGEVSTTTEMIFPENFTTCLNVLLNETIFYYKYCSKKMPQVNKTVHYSNLLK